MMHRSRKFLTTSLVAAVATVFAGCFSFIEEDTAQQSGVMADVEVTTKACTTTILGLVERPQQGPIESLDDLCVSRDEAAGFYYDDEDLGIETVPLPGQVLLSYRIPKGAEAPDTLTATAEVVHFSDWWTWRMGEGGGGGTGTGTSGERPEPPATRDAEVTFTRSDGLTAEIARYYADPDSRPEDERESIDIVGDDQQIVSYISGVVPGAMVGDWEVTAPFGLPSRSRPYAGPFNHVSMVGWRAAMTPELEPPVEERRALRAAGLLRGSVFGEMFGRLDPNRALDCGFIPRLPDMERVRRALRGDGGEDPETDLTLCPMPRLDLVEGEEGRGVDYASAFRGTDTLTRDLDVRGGSETFAEQGKTVGIPFSLVGAGPQGGKVDLTASVSPAIPGLDPVKAQIDFPGTGTSARSLELKIPESAPARTYEVVVRAARGEKGRTAKAGLVVLPKPKAPEPPAAAVAAAGSEPRPRALRGNVFMDRQGFIRFTSTCGNCSIDGLVPFGSVGDSARAAQAAGAHRLLRVARGRTRGKAGSRSKVRVKLFPKAQRALRKGRRLNGVIVFRTGASAKPEVRKVVFRTRGR